MDAFASTVNSTQNPAGAGRALCRHARGAGDYGRRIRQDVDESNPGRLWRILHLNRAIVATRTHQPDLMAEALGSLIDHLPADAAGFFSQDMEQMDLLNYPANVCAVMDRYYRKWSVNRSLH